MIVIAPLFGIAQVTIMHAMHTSLKNFSVRGQNSPYNEGYEVGRVFRLHPTSSIANIYIFRLVPYLMFFVHISQLERIIVFRSVSNLS
jgi:hypothetical protein